jgi:hypothetical protein
MNTSTLRRVIAVVGLAACVAPLAACGGRPSYWNDPVGTTSVSYGLTKGVALVDDAAHRVVMLTVPGADLNVATQTLPIGHQVVSVSASPDQSRLFVLSAGDWPRRTVNDEFPSLTVIDFPNGFVAEAHQYKMTEPRPNLAVDPNGHWAVAYSGPPSTMPSAFATTSMSSSFVQNANEIVIFDLTSPGTEVTRTLQSFGGTPRRLVFTPELALPASKGQRRLLLIETDIDLTMLDLDRAFDEPPKPPAPPEITVPLTSDTTAQQVQTAGLAVDGRNPNDPNDARFAVWASNNTNVFTLQLVAPQAGAANDFAPTIKLTDVGGIPSDVAFVQTEDATSPTGVALQVAALVPSKSSAVLVDPDKSLTTTVALPTSYASLSLVTNVAMAAGSATGTDVALLWNGGGGAQSGVALWTLTHSVMQPYASIRTLGATQPISQTYDVPTPNERLKVLQMSTGNGFYVLDLTARTAPPLQATATATLSIAPDGLRLWAFDRGGTDLAEIDFASLNPVPLTTDSAIDAVYDIARADGASNRALIAIHSEGAIGATIFDATNPVTATSRRVAPLLLEGP